MVTTLAQLVRKKRETSKRQETRLLLAAKARKLADDAFTADEHEIGRQLLAAAEYAQRLGEVGE